MREHPLTHAVLTLVGGIVTGLILMLHGWVHPIAAMKGPEGDMIPSMRTPIRWFFEPAIYSAILAPVVIGVLQRIGVSFGSVERRRGRSQVRGL